MGRSNQRDTSKLTNTPHHTTTRPGSPGQGTTMKKATFEYTTISNAINMSRDKETVRELNVCVISKGRIINPITARWYMGRSKSASVVYCSLWISGSSIYLGGHGKAGGYGCCKFSAAFAEALRSAGVNTIECSGRGMSTVREAMISICKGLGFNGKVTIIS